MSKYQPLEDFLINKGHDHVPMTFAEIEQILAFPLPPSATRHRAWWSNNPNNSTITHSWLNAGYHTASVDLAARRLTFVKHVGARRGDPVAGGPDRPDGRHLRAELSAAEPAPELAEAAAPFVTRPALLGCLAGTVAYADGADLTEPADPEWAALASGAAR